MTDMLTVTSLRKSYDRFTLEDVSLRIPSGCVVGFVGSNGAGKTTTIKSILGLISPDGGEVEVFGSPVGRGASSAQMKQRIGVVLDTMAFLGDCRIGDIARLGAASFRNWNGPLFSAMLDGYGLAPLKKISSLSRGTGMKLQMAFALAHHPDLLILDEMTAGLDPLARDEALDLLRGFMNEDGRRILMSSHITTDLEKIADYVICIDEGRVVFTKSIEEICDSAGIARCRNAELEELIDSRTFDPGAMRILRGEYGVDVLVPDRRALKGAHPSIECERASLEDYMRLTLKGEAR